MLSIPHQAAIIRIQCQGGIGIQGGIFGGEAATRCHPGLGLGGTEKHKIQIRIPAAAYPDIDAAAEFQR